MHVQAHICIEAIEESKQNQLLVNASSIQQAAILMATRMQVMHSFRQTNKEKIAYQPHKQFHIQNGTSQLARPDS